MTILFRDKESYQRLAKIIAATQPSDTECSDVVTDYNWLEMQQILWIPSVMFTAAVCLIIYTASYIVVVRCDTNRRVTRLSMRPYYIIVLYGVFELV